MNATAYDAELDERAPLARAVIRGEPLADLECPHGSLPQDRVISCACFDWRGIAAAAAAELVADVQELRHA
jgi:hypothetical protein